MVIILVLLVIFGPVADVIAEEAAGKTRMAQIKHYYQRGKERFSDGDYEAALDYFNQVIELEKGYYPIITPHAQDYIKQALDAIEEEGGVPPDAAKEPQKKREAPKEERPKLPTIAGKERIARIKRHYNEGKAHFNNEEFEKAIESFTKVVGLEKGSYAIISPHALEYIELARKMIEERAKKEVAEKEEPKEKREEIKKKIEMDIEKLRSREKEKLRDAVRNGKARIYKVKYHYKKGKTFMDKGNYEEAIENFNEVIKLERGFSPIITPYAKRYMRLCEEIVERQKEAEAEPDPKAIKDEADKYIEKIRTARARRVEEERKRIEEEKRRLEEETRRYEEDVERIEEKKRAIEKEERRKLSKEQAEEKARTSKAKAYYLKGKKLMKRRQHREAINKFYEVIKLEKDFYPLYTPFAKDYIDVAKDVVAEEDRIEEERYDEWEKRERDISIRAETRLASMEEGAEVLEYRIGVADRLFIHVWEEEALNQEVIVRPDGRVSFPLAGDVMAAGRTFGQVREELTERLMEYIRTPVVSISLVAVGGRKVIVLGEVDQPGVYGITGSKTILEAIAMAGGFTEHGKPSSTILIRGGIKRPDGARVNLNRAIMQQDSALNIELQAEDIIYVPKKFIADVAYFVDNIIAPLTEGFLSVYSLGVLTEFIIPSD